MKKKRFTETQIVSILKQQEGGRTIKELARENAISEATIYNWKSKYGDMKSSDVKRLKDLEKENSKLKKDVCYCSHGQSNTEGFVLKKRLGPATTRQLTKELVHKYDIPVSRACKIIANPRSQLYYESKKYDSEVIEA